MKILEANINKTLSEYQSIVSKLAESHSEMLVRYFQETPCVSEETKAEILNVLTSDLDFKSFSIYGEASFIFSLLQFGILPILDMDESYDSYSFYNQELWAHRVGGDWTRVDDDDISDDLRKLLQSVPYTFKNNVNIASENLAKGITRNTLLSISDWKFIDDSIFGTGWTIKRAMPSIAEQESLFQQIYGDIVEIEPEIVESIINDIENKVENWNTRYGLMVDVTDVDVYRDTPIPRDLISGFQFIQWLILKVKFSSPMKRIMKKG